mmetsp:Transcript_31007/g.47288  ORF Transcript_31007/g.47288 Transcript_31007/m.47288 type:complete len:515 (+) Transcript_31007:116-1660(+)|eukprot:CAMPEP_0194253862 /NCGR_PEP_ID=MMETSP0158-20130606/30801_1 /TAXON_ID=33649 /ORGANISM="Thalassionema nitzschioides, Strain L26-B" /LENGTH=514 /DNA_ID=CAMNT_0038991697 /DNA_START=13 /DNA_END=1557 /DNA_ORIENTATION=-
MVSIPTDPGVTLGNIVDPRRLDQLKQLSEAMKPEGLANDKLNNLLQSTYKIKMVIDQMTNMGMDPRGMLKLIERRDKLKLAVAEAAIELMDATIEAEEKVEALENQFAQTTITATIESPLDYGLCSIKHFPLSFDSIKFDVQFFKKESNEDANSAINHATAVSKYVYKKKRIDIKIFGITILSFGKAKSTESSENTFSSQMEQSSKADLEGTIVITANCTHKQADIIDPFYLNPKKAVAAWNAMNPGDMLQTDPQSMLAAALAPEGGEGGAEGKAKGKPLQIISGCTRGSSFSGYVHLFKSEHSSSTQSSDSIAKSAQRASETALFFIEVGSYGGDAKTISNAAKSLLSTSQVTNSCSFHVEGLIPTIETGVLSTVVQQMKPDPAATSANLQAINQAANDKTSANMAAANSDGKTSAQFMNLDNSHMQNTVRSMNAIADNQNKVIDMNTMFTALDEYVRKAMKGDMGVPLSYYLKELPKKEIAKVYIRRYYPNGITSFQDTLSGTIGEDGRKNN